MTGVWDQIKKDRKGLEGGDTLLPFLLPLLDEAEIPIDAVRQTLGRLILLIRLHVVVAYLPTSGLDSKRMVQVREMGQMSPLVSD